MNSNIALERIVWAGIRYYGQSSSKITKLNGMTSFLLKKRKKVSLSWVTPEGRYVGIINENTKLVEMKNDLESEIFIV